MTFEINNLADIEALLRQLATSITSDRQSERPSEPPAGRETASTDGQDRRHEDRENEQPESAAKSDEPRDSDSEAPSVRDGDEFPEIIITGRQLRDLSFEGIDALQASNIPPRIFIKCSSLVHLIKNEQGRHVIAEMTSPRLRGCLSRSADFVRLTKTGALVGVNPPPALVDDILAAPPDDWRFPSIEAVVGVPVLRPDGTILDVPGYDSATRLFYDPDPELSIPDVPATPTARQIAEAVALLHSVIVDFPFVDADSRANMIAAMITPHLLAAIDGSTPMGLIDATSAGTGKSLLADTVAIILTGQPADMLSAPVDPDEWRKQITTLLMDGRRLAVFDNLKQSIALDSPELCKAITERNHSDRLMATHKSIILPVKCAWLATGNNIKVGGDMPRRCYWIRMEVQTSNPFLREGFQQPDLKDWVRGNRGAIISAILTLSRAWYAAGCPRPSVKPVGSFERWTVIVGGVLENAGVTGFLNNISEFHLQADDESLEWEGLLSTLKTLNPTNDFTVAEIIAKLAETAWGRPTPSAADLRAALPGSLADFIEHPGKLSRRLGAAFAQREGRRFGERELYIKRTGEVSHSAQCWRVFDKNSSQIPG
jgi:hypothetical protein